MARAQEIQDEILEEAAAWVVRLRAEPSDADLERFDAWRSQSELHVRCFEEASEAWAAFGGHSTSPQLLIMRRDALDRARRQKNRWHRRPVVAAVALLAIVPALGIAWHQWRSSSEHEYQTARGEQKIIVLPD